MTEVVSYPVRYVTTTKFSEVSGLSMKAIEGKIARGTWLEGKHFYRRDGRIYINLKEYEKWIEKEET